MPPTATTILINRTFITTVAFFCRCIVLGLPGAPAEERADAARFDRLLFACRNTFGGRRPRRVGHWHGRCLRRSRRPAPRG